MEVMGATSAFVDKYRKEGKLKEIYNLVGLKGAVSIWEIGSAEDGDRLFLEYPLFPFVDVEMHVLKDYDAYAKALKEAYQQLAKK